jgi:hypothetical protein
MQMPKSVRMFLHRRGWIASPSLAFMGVPFGPEKRDLAGDVMRRIAADHDAGNCSVCFPDACREMPESSDR